MMVAAWSDAQDAGGRKKFGKSELATPARTGHIGRDACYRGEAVKLRCNAPDGDLGSPSGRRALALRRVCTPRCRWPQKKTPPSSAGGRERLMVQRSARTRTRPG